MNQDEFQTKYPLLYQEYGEDLPKDIKTGSRKKIKWKCSKCQYEWSTRLSHRTSGSGCPKCSSHWSRLTANKKSIQDINPAIASELVNPLFATQLCANSNKLIEWQCKKCKGVWITNPLNRITGGQGCPFCSGRTKHICESIAIKNPELCKEWFDEKSPQLFGPFSSKKIKWKCLLCHHIWHSTINNRSKGRGCPLCRKRQSKAHLKIREILLSKKVDFKEEYRLEKCRDNRTLPFDFAIFSNNKLQLLIEYQGEQHYKPLYGTKNFMKTIYHDQLKKNFCNLNNIPLLEIICTSKETEFNDIISNFLDISLRSKL